MGNTTSERVSGERHGSKSHRSDGSGAPHPAKEHPHKIMVGSTDDPSVFSSHDSKIPGDKEFVSWQPDLEESVKPSQQARPTVIRWADGATTTLSLSWTSQKENTSTNFLWMASGSMTHPSSLQPVVTSQMGTINNLIHVKKSDFEVFDALKVDSLESSETSGRDLSSSPPGPYGQEMYVYRPEERFKSPPILPPHLLQVILNKDTNISCDPALLPEPNHVMLNHLYALSIKDGVMVLSATHRYKKKYVTTLLYKPI
ncbi:5'-AMP-activated protein kinase subunit beta-2 isoform 3-T3 [Leptosomus discolor]